MLHLTGRRAEHALLRIRGGQPGCGVEWATVTASPDVQVEAVHRNIVRPVEVSACFQEAALIWHLDGLDHCQVTVNGQRHRPDRPGTSLMLVPTGSQFAIRLPSNGLVRYTTIRIRSTSSVEFPADVVRYPVFDIRHPELLHAVELLCREAEAPDDGFDMLAESWMLQAHVYLGRLAAASPVVACHRGGLAGAHRSRVADYIQANLAGPIRIDVLARLTGLGPRHFSRAFQQSFSRTPMSYVIALRVQEARRQLAETTASITEIATSCGFSHIQHFTTTFRKHVGMTPSDYRRGGRA